MKLFYDFLPVFAFFVVFKWAGIYYATGTFLVAALLQIGLYWLRYRRFENMHLTTFFIGAIMGGATLLFHDDLFIKWKPTAIYWSFAVVFLGSQFIGAKSVTQRMLENTMQLPLTTWARLNLSWICFFTIMGVINLYVVYHYDTNTWVNFKLFGMMGLTFLFILAQGVFLNKHLRIEKQ